MSIVAGNRVGINERTKVSVSILAVKRVGINQREKVVDVNFSSQHKGDN